MDEEHIKFQITKIKEALEILRKIHNELFDAMNLKSQQNPNESGRLDRIIKEYIEPVAELQIEQKERNKTTYSLDLYVEFFSFHSIWSRLRGRFCFILSISAH